MELSKTKTGRPIIIFTTGEWDDLQRRVKEILKNPPNENRVVLPRKVEPTERDSYNVMMVFVRFIKEKKINFKIK